jgi:hypothetical protein
MLIEIPACHPSQERFLSETKRFNCLVAGRRWGKNVVALHRLAPLALTSQPVGFFSPSYKLLAESWRDFKALLGPAITRCSETEKRIELIGGGVIEFWSLHDDENAGRSRKYRHVVIDEAGQVGNLEQVVNNAIRPTLTDLVGSMDLMGTPRGRGYFYRCYCKGQDPEQTDWMSWRFPSSDNPHLPPGEIEQARKDLPDRVFRQEMLAEFMDDAGGVFRSVMEAIDIGRTQNAEDAAQPIDVAFGAQQRYGKVREPKRQRQAAFKDVWGRPDRDETPVPWERYSDRDPINDPPEEPPKKPERPEAVTYSMGIDLARINDFTVVTVIDSTGRQVYFDRWNKTSWARSVSGIVDVANRFKPHIYCDSTGIGDAIFEQLERAGLYVSPFVFTNSSKKQLMDGLAGMIEQHKIRLMDIPVQTGELVNYEYRVTAARNVQMTAPDGEHDDCVCALALAAWGIGTGGFWSAGAY